MTYPQLYNLGLIRTDRGEFKDAGNQVYDVTNPRFGKGGARGDGVTDDSAAFQDAIDAARSAAAGTIYVPAGQFMLRTGLDLTGVSVSNGTDNIAFRGANKYGTTLLCGFDGGSALDLSDSSFMKLSDFRVKYSGSYRPDQLILMARPSDNDSSGDHTLIDLWLDGKCNNATVVVWSAEQLQFYSCLVWASADHPALAAAVNMPELGFTPTSPFVTLGNGAGGVTCCTVIGTRFGNESGTTAGSDYSQTSPLLKLYGTLGWAFRDCFFAADTQNLIDINHSTHPANPSIVYYAGLTFENCTHENAWHPTKEPQRSLYFSTPNTAGLSITKYLAVRDCSFYDIYAEDTTTVEGFGYEGGKYTPSVASPASGRDKISLYDAPNAYIRPSYAERDLDYFIRHGAGASCTFIGITTGHVGQGNTKYTIQDISGNHTSAGFIKSASPTGGVGYEGGAGGTVVQSGSITTAVQLDKVCGRITTVSLSLAAGAYAAFQVNNSTVASVDNVIVNIQSYSGSGRPLVRVWSISTGGFVVEIKNDHPTDALDAAAVLAFAIFKSNIA